MATKLRLLLAGNHLRQGWVILLVDFLLPLPDMGVILQGLPQAIMVRSLSLATRQDPALMIDDQGEAVTGIRIKIEDSVENKIWRGKL